MTAAWLGETIRRMTNELGETEATKEAAIVDEVNVREELKQFAAAALSAVPGATDAIVIVVLGDTTRAELAVVGTEGQPSPVRLIRALGAAGQVLFKTPG